MLCLVLFWQLFLFLYVTLFAQILLCYSKTPPDIRDVEAVQRRAGVVHLSSAVMTRVLFSDSRPTISRPNPYRPTANRDRCCGGSHRCCAHHYRRHCVEEIPATEVRMCSCYCGLFQPKSYVFLYWEVYSICRFSGDSATFQGAP